MKKPTQNDVAKLAGVSRGTVSMVLREKTSGRVPISEETARRVMEAMQTLGYAPNPVAQMLKQGNNRLIGLFAYESVFPYQTRTLLMPDIVGVKETASELDYNILLFTRHQQNAIPQIYVNNMNSLLLADGTLILGSYPERDELRRLTEEGYPFVCVGRREVSGASVSWVGHDYATTSQQIAEHLIALGHERLGFVYDQHPLTFEPNQDKLQGLQAAIDAAPGAALKMLNTPVGDDLLKFIGQHQLTGLIFADSWNFAERIALLRQYGVRIPDDLSVVSLVPLDNPPIYEGEIAHLELDRRRAAALATRTLVGLLDGSLDLPQQQMIPCAFVEGSSIATPPQRRTRKIT